MKSWKSRDYRIIRGGTAGVAGRGSAGVSLYDLVNAVEANARLWPA